MKMTHNIEQSAAKITDPKQREDLLAELRLIRANTDNDNLCYLEEVLDLVGCDTFCVQFDASKFIQKYAQPLGWSSVKLAGEIIKSLEQAGKPFSREMLYRCLLDVCWKQPGRTLAVNPAILLSELAKDIATANESAASEPNRQLPRGFPLPQRGEFITLTLALECLNAVAAESFPWDNSAYPKPTAAALEGISRTLLARCSWGPNPDEREAIEAIGRQVARISSKSP